MITQHRPASGHEALANAIEELGVGVVAGLPDDWVAPLLGRLEERESLRVVRVAREPEAVAICSGAFFGGVRSVAVMGSTGLLTCISELVTLNLKHQVPLLLIVSDRGSVDDTQVFQELQGRVMHPLCEALGIPSILLDSPADVTRVPEAFAASRLHKRPYVVWISRRFVHGERDEGQEAT